jgi:hypothetical protein
VTEILARIYEPSPDGRRPPECLHVAGFTYVPLDGGGFGYTALVIDAFAGLIAGWECSLSKEIAFVERAIRQAAAWRARQGRPLGNGAIRHSDAGSQPRSGSLRPCCWPPAEAEAGTASRQPTPRTYVAKSGEQRVYESVLVRRTYREGARSGTRRWRTCRRCRPKRSPRSRPP